MKDVERKPTGFEKVRDQEVHVKVIPSWREKSHLQHGSEAVKMDDVARYPFPIPAR